MVGRGWRKEKKKKGERKKRGAKYGSECLISFAPVPVGGPSSFQRFSSERGLDINILNEGWTRKNR